jgi:hypothetical protein
MTLSILHPAYRPRKQRVNVGAIDFSTGQFEIKVRSR